MLGGFRYVFRCMLFASRFVCEPLVYCRCLITWRYCCFCKFEQHQPHTTRLRIEPYDSHKTGATIPYYIDGKRAQIRHELNPERSAVSTESTVQGMLWGGYVPGVRNPPVAMWSSVQSVFLMVGGGTTSDSVYIAEAREPDNENVKHSFETLWVQPGLFNMK